MRRPRLLTLSFLVASGIAAPALAGGWHRSTCDDGCSGQAHGHGHIHGFCKQWISGRRLVRFQGGPHRPLPTLSGPAGYWDMPDGSYPMGGSNRMIMGDPLPSALPAPPVGQAPAATVTPPAS